MHSGIKSVGEGVAEYKIDFGPGYRIYFGKDGDRLVILIGGGTKKRQQKRHRHGESDVAGIQAAQERTGELKMALTKDFRDTIRERAQREPSFRQGLLREGLELINNGDFATGRAILRNYINATIGFPRLARMTRISSPSLQRMFGPAGNPRAENLFGVLAHLQRQEGVNIELQVRPH